MPNTQASITGAFIASAGVIVSALGYVGVSTNVTDITNVIGAIAIVYGLIHQIVVHFSTKSVAAAS